jgi:hypothetical protein
MTPMKEAGERVEDQHAEEGGQRGDEVGHAGDAVHGSEGARVDAIEADERATSTSSTSAAITTAASVASGSCSKSPVRKRSVTTVSAATTSPESCDLAPAAPFTAVFERLPFTTIPLESPETRFAVPRPSSSRFGSTS